MLLDDDIVTDGEPKSCALSSRLRCEKRVEHFFCLAQPDGPRWTPQQAQAALKDAKGTKLVLLGAAAGPVPGRSREMTSHVMLSNGSAYVLDCGMGVTNQFARTGIPFSALKSIFITHHHADHNIEYGPLLIVGWIQGLPLGVLPQVRDARRRKRIREPHS